MMFVGKARAYASETPFRVGSWPYPQALDQAVKAFQEHTLYLITKIRKLRTKTFYNFRPFCQLF